MAVALRPADFDCGEAPPDGSAWEIFGEEYRTNPKLLLGDSEHAMLQVWALYRRGGMGGSGHLPDRGGILQQTCLTMAALEEMDHAAADIERERDDERRSQQKGRAR